MLLDSVPFVYMYLYIVCTAYTRTTTACLFCCKCGDIQPVDPVFFINETLEINCTLTTPNNETNSSSLFLKHSGERLDEQYYEFVDDSTLSLRKVADITDRGTYFCYRNNERMADFVGAVEVVVDYAPTSVTDIECVWYHWKRGLECTWKLPPYYSHHTNVTLQWYNGGHGTCSKMNKEMTSCIISPHEAALDVLVWYFRLSVTNTIRNITAESPVIKKFQKNNVKPNKVNSFTYRFTNDSRCLQLIWTYDIYISAYRTKYFRVRYESASGLEKVQMSNDTNYKMVVCGLDPFTEYNFTIDVKAGKIGYWSDPVSQSVVTDEDVPAAAPEINTGGFQRHSSVCRQNPNGLYDLDIYWTRIPKTYARGIITEHILSFREEFGVDDPLQEIEVVFTASASFGTVKLKCSCSYNIQLRTATSKGISPRSTPLHIPKYSRTDVQPPQVRVERTGRHYEVSWTREPISYISTLISYTVFYCTRLNKSICHDVLRVRKVDPDANRTEIYVPDTGKEYLFGVSVNTRSFSTGMRLISCIYNKYTEPPSPSGLTIYNQEDKRHLFVTWNHVTCAENAPFVVNYTIKWCRMSNNTARTETDCVGQEQIVPANQPPVFALKGLENGENYGIQIRSSSSIKSGIYSDLLLLETKFGEKLDCQRNLDPLMICLVAATSSLLVSCLMLLLYNYKLRRHTLRSKGTDMNTEVFSETLAENKIIKRQSSNDSGTSSLNEEQQL